MRGLAARDQFHSVRLLHSRDVLDDRGVVRIDHVVFVGAVNAGHLGAVGIAELIAVVEIRPMQRRPAVRCGRLTHRDGRREGARAAQGAF